MEKKIRSVFITKKKLDSYLINKERQINIVMG